MTENDKIKNEAIDMALSIMEHSEEWTEERLKEAMEDKVCMQTCQDILDCRLAMQQEALSNKLDVDEEWRKFQNRHMCRATRKWIPIGKTIGIAASFVLILIFSWVVGSNQKSKDAVVYFEAIDESVNDITLQTTEGVHMLSKQLTQEVLDCSGGVLVKADSMRLEYADAAGQVDMHILTTPRGKTFEVVLSDGTKVWLNADSRLEYPSRFVGDMRVVKLDGEAYFQVTENKENPFVVETSGIKTVVLGTEFNVRTYQEESSHVTLIKGSVKVCNSEGENSTLLLPGENAKLLEDGSFSKQQVDVDTYVYWKEGYFYFDNVRFADIMQDIGRWYNVNIVFDNSRVMDYKLRYFCKRDEGIGKAIERLQCMKKAQVSMEGNTIFIR